MSFEHPYEREDEEIRKAFAEKDKEIARLRDFHQRLLLALKEEIAVLKLYADQHYRGELSDLRQEVHATCDAISRIIMRN